MKKFLFIIGFAAALTLFFLLTAERLIAKEKSGDVGDVKIVKNEGSGAWHRSGKKVSFNKTLSIGVFEEDENEMFHTPMDVAVDDSGNIYVLDTGNNRIQKFDQKGNYLLTIGRKGEGPGELLKVWDIELDSKGNIVVFDWMTNRISTFNGQGQLMGSFKVNLRPYYGVVDSSDHIYIYSMNNGKLIHKYSPKGEFLFSFLSTVESQHKRTETHINSMGGIGISRDDKIYLALIYPYTIYVCNKEGKLLNKFITNTDYAVPPHLTSNNVVIVNFHIIGLDVSPQGYIFCRNIFFNIPDQFDIEKLKAIYYSRFQNHSYIDIFDPEGNFLVHQKADGFSSGGCFDPEGNYYGIEEGDDCFKALKYSIQF
jgi:hypothetical protein